MVDRTFSLPFRVDSLGRSATTTDPVTIGRQQITTFLLTQPGERVMRPNFGAPIRDSLFESLDSVTEQLLLTRVQAKVQDWVPTVVLRSLVSETDSDQGAIRFTVEFALAVGAGEGAVSSTTISLGGAQ